MFRSRYLFNATLLLSASLFILAACSNPKTTKPPSEPSPKKALGEAKFGAYISGSIWTNEAAIAQLEDAIKREFDIIQWFTSWDDPYESYPVERILAAGKKPLITWQSHGETLDEILAGDHDSYLREWAQNIRHSSGPVYLRPFPEMNGDWVPWHGEPKKLVQSWRYVVNIFREEGASQARWVWSPNITDWPRTEANRFENYYPGTDYVDVLALDGFNWGTSREWHVWKSFDEIFSEPYERITALGPQTLWITEVASTEEGGDKAQWVQDMLSSTAFPRITALVWFNEYKETDWRIESSERSLESFRSWFSAQNQSTETLAQNP